MCPDAQEPICLRVGGGDYSNGWQPVQAGIDEAEAEVPEQRPLPPWTASFAGEAVQAGNLSRYAAPPPAVVPADRKADPRRVPSLKEMDLS